MGINAFDSDEGLDLGPKVREQVTEQYSEKTKKAQIQLKRIQKDEKMAKGDNEKLFLVLQRFIADGYYAPLMNDVVYFLQIGVPSRAIIAFLSLFYPDATFYVADSLGKKEKLNLLLSLPRYEVIEYFDEKKLHPAIAEWMSEWIILMEAFIISHDSSILMNKKFLEIISGQNMSTIEKNLSHMLVFFFASRNIKIDENVAHNYIRFILKNIRENLQKYIDSQQENIKELLEDAMNDVNQFFGN